MKVNTSRMWRSGIAMLLALCLVVGFFPAAAFATSGGVEGTVEPEKPLYVSLGDSMTNGYGLDGYEYQYYWNNGWFECTDPNCTEANRVPGHEYHAANPWGDANGFRQVAWDAYPNKMAEKYDWNHEQLAMAGMTSDMMRWILEFPIDPEDPNHELAMEILTMEYWSTYECIDDDEHLGDNCVLCIMNNGKEVEENWHSIWNYGDFHTYDQGPDSARMEKFCPYDVSPEMYTTLGSTGDTVAEYIKLYQDAVADADIISLCIGNGDFGNHMLNRIMWLIVGATDHELRYQMEYVMGSLTDDQKAAILELEKKLQDQIVLPDVPKENSDRVIECMLYTTMSYIVNFEGIMKQISVLNPNAEIILLGMVESMKGLTIRMEDGTFFPLGDIMDECVDFGNAFAAAYVAKLQEDETVTNEIYFAEATEDVDLIYETYSTEVYRPENLVVRARFVSSITDSFDDIAYGMAQIAGAGSTEYIEYFNFENIVSSVDKVKTYENDGTFNIGNINHIGYEIYLGLEKAIVESVHDGALTIEGLGLVYGDASNGYNHVVTAINEWKANPAGAKLSDVIAEALTSNINTKSVMYQYARCNVGNFLGNHPTVDGHQVLFEAVDAAYAEKHTPTQETEDNLKAALEAVVEAVKKYGPEAGKAVWERWEEMGYVGEVEAYIDELIDTVEIRYDYYANEALPAIEAAIDALKGEKDVLVAELDELNAQLAKKKAELEAVINGIEIGSIYIPEINIDPIGGNEQTEVPAYDCEVEGEGIVAELEAAIRDLEHAIAVVEALIADVDADLADMAKLAAQIADAVKELNKTYESIVVAAEDLYDAFKAIEEVLTNDADQSIEAVTSAFEAARSTALAALDVLEVAMGYARELDADILAEVDNIVELAESLYNKFISEDSLEAYVAAIVDKVLPQMTEEEQLIVAAAAAILEEIAPEVIAYAEELLPIKIAELKAECRKEIEALIEEYKPQIEQAEKDLEAKWEEIKPQIEAKYEEAKAELEAEYEATVAALEAKRAELIAELIAAEAELKSAVEELKGEAADKLEAAVAPLKAQIARLEKDIATVTADLAHAAGHLETALKLAYEEAKIAVMALYNEAMAQLNAAIEALKAQLEQAIEDLKNALKNMIEDALGELLDEVKKTVEELKNSLIAMGIETVEELVDALVALFNELLYQATHADLVIDEDFKYVALGDGSAAADGYAEALNAYLAAEAAENGINSIEFVNEAEIGNSVAAEAADLSAEVADADLITLGFSQTDMLANAITAGELDWAALLGAEAVPYVEEALAKVAAEIDALELPEEMKELLKATVEAYAYNVVEYTINLPQLIYAIREVNEDAVVIVVGMYNPIDDITAFGYDLSAVGEYFDYLIEAADAYGIGLAMLTNELDYVVADEVEIAQSELSLGDLGDLLDGDLSVMYPSANGDAYIAERIENALTLSFEVGGLWGDADGDGVVTPIDAMLVLQYYVGDITAAELNVNVCDVDDDGAVSPIDAMLILQYYVGDIAKFPVEG